MTSLWQEQEMRLLCPYCYTWLSEPLDAFLLTQTLVCPQCIHLVAKAENKGDHFIVQTAKGTKVLLSD